MAVPSEARLRRAKDGAANRIRTGVNGLKARRPNQTRRWRQMSFDFAQDTAKL